MKIWELIIITLLIAAYLMPTMIAMARGSKHRAPIAIFNIMLGWTGLGWIGALVWSVA